ncbi:peptidase dimerization domain-containing protein [Pseudoflavonifractor phocaeensis]|nr:peptidase dimerization domain-containing protein [Pseudoflavonifractor phocaeensis]
MAEPHFDNIVVGATGKVLLKLEVTGAPGHAAMPEKGINAVDCMAALLQAVNQTWGSCYPEKGTSFQGRFDTRRLYSGWSAAPHQLWNNPFASANSLSIPADCQAASRCGFRQSSPEYCLNG